MVSVAEAEARVERGEAAIRQREAERGYAPNEWYEALEDAWRDVVACRERERPDETARYQRTATYRLMRQAERPKGGPLVQAGLAISAGRWA